MKSPYEYDDAEPNLFLRKLREKLGYGVGWTFWGALVEWILPKLILLALISAWLFLSIHVRIEISLR
jgi:hypothetical protein